MDQKVIVKRKEIKAERIKIPKLENLAMNLLERGLSREEILKECGDKTDLFYQELKDKQERGEVIRINFNGEVRTGKSTAASEICRHINEDLLKKRMGLKNICVDQMHFVNKIKDKDTKDICIQVDEHNELGNTGDNSTTESALRANFNEVQAARHIHQVYCSPARDDPFSKIVLETKYMDVVNKKTTALMYYRLNDPSMFWSSKTQLVGYIKIDVSKILEYKWYKDYLERKMKVIEITGTIRDSRELRMAPMVKHIYNDLKSLTKSTNISRAIIMGHIKATSMQFKELLSIVAEERIADKLHSLLSLTREKNKLIIEMAKLNEKGAKLGVSINLKDILKEKQEAFVAINRILNIQLDTWNDLIKINEELNKLTEEE